MKRTLTALTALALLFPLSVNAENVGKEKSVEIMYYGEVMSMTHDNLVTNFIIKYQKAIFECIFYGVFDTPRPVVQCFDMEN